MTPADSLLRRMLAAARTGSVSRAQRLAFNRETAELGSEAMAEAQRQLGETREAQRCAEAMKLTHPSEQASSEVAS